MRTQWIEIFVVGACLASAGCTSKESAPAEQAAESPKAEPSTPELAKTEVAEADPAAEAKEIFQDRCTVCHGQTGKGDGPGSAALDPKPRNFTSVEWQESVTDDHIHKIIVYGGIAVGKSAAMPANPDLDSKPQVVDELVKIVRSLEGK
ncbi:MAG: c-type cytochrome [Myxococcales bacterium]|jgi:mono/diheme cytochrome c family protein